MPRRAWPILIAVFVLLAASNAAPQRAPEVEILETKAHRDGGRIFVDVRVRARAQKPLRGLIIYFDLLSPENGVVTSQKLVLEEDSLPSGQERSSQSVASDHVRAVRYKIRAFDRAETELRVGNSGPFPIE
jgi:hypothetical protein